MLANDSYYGEELGISKGTLYTWVDQDLVDHGKRVGLTTREHGERVADKRRIRELETMLAIVRRASELFKALMPAQKVLPG